jgi:hypothetical protein
MPATSLIRVVGHEPVLPKSTSDAGGGHAHCGAMIYLGDNWPERYRNRIFFNNVHGNRVNCDILERQGSGYTGRHGPDFLLANDRWFRGINLKCGPDGTVHLIDWYDKNACHRADPEIWDRSNGRIYRIAYGDVRPVKVDLARLPSAELVGLARHSTLPAHGGGSSRSGARRGRRRPSELSTAMPSITVRLRAPGPSATGGLAGSACRRPRQPRGAPASLGDPARASRTVRRRPRCASWLAW